MVGQNTHWREQLSQAEEEEEMVFLASLLHLFRDDLRKCFAFMVFPDISVDDWRLGEGEGWVVVRKSKALNK